MDRATLPVSYPNLQWSRVGSSCSGYRKAITISRSASAKRTIRTSWVRMFDAAGHRKKRWHPLVPTCFFIECCEDLQERAYGRKSLVDAMLPQSADLCLHT